MTGGSIKNNTGSGLDLGRGTGTMSGGEISGHTSGDGYGVNISSTEGRFTMSGNAVISDNTIGVYQTGNSGASFTMTGGTIADNVTRGVASMAGTTFTMTGGTISKSGSPNTGIWLNSSNTVCVFDGTVTLSNVSVSVGGGSTGNVSTIYLGGNFGITHPSDPIKIDLYGSNTTNFNGSWGSANGGAFLKGLPTASPTAITADQLAKFTRGKAYQGTSLTELSGTVSLELNSSNFGVAKWAADE
jgi:hypothetical protein